MWHPLNKNTWRASGTLPSWPSPSAFPSKPGCCAWGHPCCSFSRCLLDGGAPLFCPELWPRRGRRRKSTPESIPFAQEEGLWWGQGYFSASLKMATTRGQHVTHVRAGCECVVTVQRAHFRWLFPAPPRHTYTLEPARLPWPPLLGMALRSPRRPPINHQE